MQRESALLPDDPKHADSLCLFDLRFRFSLFTEAVPPEGDSTDGQPHGRSGRATTLYHVSATRCAEGPGHAYAQPEPPNDTRFRIAGPADTLLL